MTYRTSETITLFNTCIKTGKGKKGDWYAVVGYVYMKAEKPLWLFWEEKEDAVEAAKTPFGKRSVVKVTIGIVDGGVRDIKVLSDEGKKVLVTHIPFKAKDKAKDGEKKTENKASKPKGVAVPN